MVPSAGGYTAELAPKKQGFSVTYPNAIPKPAAWNDGSILFSGTFHDSTNLWRMSTSQRNWRVSRPAHRLTFGSGFEVSPSVAISGHIAFAAVSPSAKNRNPPIDATPIRVTGTNSRVTDGVWSDTSPPTSADYSNRSGGGQRNRLDTGFRTGRVPTGHQLFLSRRSRVAHSTDAGDCFRPAGPRLQGRRFSQMTSTVCFRAGSPQTSAGSHFSRGRNTRSERSS